MNNLTKALMEELTVEYVKVGPLQIPESVVISWVIMVLVVLGSILLTRNLKVDHISKRQAVLEMAYTAGKNFFEGLLGKEGACYVPYLMTVAIYIACSNLIGVFGVKPPTKDLDVTAALALMSIVLIEGSGIRARGGVGHFLHLGASGVDAVHLGGREQQRQSDEQRHGHAGRRRALLVAEYRLTLHGAIHLPFH